MAKTKDHILTAEDLKNNPELVSKGLKAGDSVQIPDDSDIAADKAKAEAEAAAKLATEEAAEAAAAKPGKTKKVAVLMEFRDKNDFDKVYSVGDNVNHFDEERIEDLKAKGLVK